MIQKHDGFELTKEESYALRNYEQRHNRTNYTYHDIKESFINLNQSIIHYTPVRTIEVPTKNSGRKPRSIIMVGIEIGYMSTLHFQNTHAYCFCLKNGHTRYIWYIYDFSSYRCWINVSKDTATPMKPCQCNLNRSPPKKPNNQSVYFTTSLVNAT